MKSEPHTVASNTEHGSANLRPKRSLTTHCRSTPGTTYCPSQARRKGSVLIEMVVMTIVVSVVATVLLPMLSAVRKTSRATKYEHLAMIELNNIHERLQAMSQTERDEILSGESAILTGTWFQQRYPQSQLTVTSAASAAPPIQPSLQPFRITIAYQDTVHYPGRNPVTVVVWVPAGTEDAK
jgi:type II secretory pathway pseudopilin PulG